jgi:hypothetical protein
MTFDILRLKLKFYKYLRVNWGYVFIIGFILLLFCAALLLSFGAAWSYSAEIIGDCAFFALVAGVILQLVCLLKAKKIVDGTEAM